MQVRRIFSISLIFTALLAGCATPVSTNIQPSAANVAKYSDLSDINVVAALEKNVKDAKASDMPFLAPNYYKEAAQVLSECQGQLGNTPRDVLVKNAARGDAILEKGRAVMAIVKYRFAPELEVKARIDALNTAKLLPKDYENVTRDLSRMIEGVEREQPGNIDREKEALLKRMQDLEVRAVQEGALHEAEAVNAASKKNNAEKQAPVTFAEAQRIYQEAQKQIAAAHHDEKLVQRQGAQALFAARHAQQVNERVAALQSQLNFSSSGGTGVSLAGAAGGGGGALGVSVGGGGQAGVEKTTLEKIVLQEEDRLLAISTALGMRDLRDLPLDKQVVEIKRTAGEMAGTSKGAAVQELEARLKAANDATQQATAQLAAKDKQLKDQAALLADKDAQIGALDDKVKKLEAGQKPAAKPKVAKPKAVQPKKQ
ncbi:MAG TPA: hypothetical protein VIU46_04735 [Gallionellaceae bacterium]